MFAPFFHCSPDDIAAIEGWLRERREWQWLQANPFAGGDTGRAPMPMRVASTVNGQEVRVSPRWYSLGRAGLGDADLTCYSVKPDGSREPFIVPRENGNGSRRKSGANVGAAYAERVKRYGANTELAAE